MNNNEKFDLIIAGISHARNFSRYKNHLIVEKILNKKILNIGQGGGACSANEQNFYLSYFYDNGNSANTLLYVLSPPLLYSETLSKASNTFELEPFQFRFFLSYLFYNSENKYQRLFYYIKSKFQKNWINYMPESIADKTEKLVSLDTTEVNMGFKLAYPKGLDSSVFNYNVSVVENTIKLALKNKSKVVMIIPPALFGHWPGHSKTADFAKKMKEIYHIQFYDFSEAVLEPQYYYDHHHLNTKGVIFFTDKSIKHIL